MSKRRIAIIGAGVSGLIAIKCCLDEDLEPVCLERSDKIGGLWRYEENVTDGQSCVMKTTVINTSKEMMCFSDYPIPAEYPNYMHNTKVMDYFKSYADQFNMLKYIQFKKEIIAVKQSENFSKTGQWRIEIRDLASGKNYIETFDGVYVCTGHHADKKWPNFPGYDVFEGKQLHTHDYRNHKGYEDKKVVVVGIGNSGGDVAVELSKICSQVYLSTRRGAWILHRVGDHGQPSDMQNGRRVFEAIKSVFPESVFNSFAEKRVEQRLDHEKYSLRPEHRFNGQHPTVNDELPNRIICGSVIVKPNIKQLGKRSVEFDDGTVIEDVDAIIYATGYIFGFPFIDKSIINVKDNRVDLFKYCFPPELSPPTLAVIGFIQPWGAIMPIAELQCRWAARVFKGDIALPPRDEMWKDIHNKERAMAKRYVASTRHTIQVDWIPFMDEVAEQAGCKPDLWKLFWDDPVLALICFFGPCTPYQFRLQGPHPWAGAREAIMTQWDRVYAPLNTRPVNVSKNSNNIIKYFIITVVVAILFLWLF